MNKKVAVIGAGITGVTTAYYLAKSNHDVYVFDIERYPAMRTSFANGGQVSVSNSEVWTTYSNIKKGVKWLFTKDAPLLIRPKFEINKIKWLYKFLKATITNQYYFNTKKTIQMGLKARELYKDIINNEKINFDQSYCGILHFYKSDEYWQNAIKAQAIYEESGCEFDLLTLEELYSIDSALKNIKGIVGGAFTINDWTGDIHKFCMEITKILKNKYDVKFNFNSEIIDLNKFSNDFDYVIVCAGVGSVKLAKSVGDYLPIYPVKGYSITINAIDEKSYKAMPKVSLLDDQAKIVTSTLGKRFRVAGTAELDGENYDIRKDRIEPLLKWVHTNFPDIDTSNYSSWACLRPMTPDMMPITKQSDKNDKIFYNTGHGHLGWTLAPYTAKQIMDIVNASY